MSKNTSEKGPSRIFVETALRNAPMAGLYVLLVMGICGWVGLEIDILDGENNGGGIFGSAVGAGIAGGSLVAFGRETS